MTKRFPALVVLIKKRGANARDAENGKIGLNFTRKGVEYRVGVGFVQMLARKFGGGKRKIPPHES